MLLLDKQVPEYRSRKVGSGKKEESDNREKRLKERVE